MSRRPSKLQILLVEDKPADAELVKGMLQSGDAYECTIVTSLAQALKAIEDNEYDLALLDLHLADSYGPSTVQALVRQRADLPVVVVTGDLSPEAEVAATTAGAAGFITKAAMTAEDLQIEIRVAMARHSRQVFNQSVDLPPPPFDTHPVTNPGFSMHDMEGEIAESVANRLAREFSKIPLVIQREMNPLAGDLAEIKATLRVIQSTVDGHSRILTGGSTPEKGLMHRVAVLQSDFNSHKSFCESQATFEKVSKVGEDKETSVLVERTKARSAVQITLITVLGAVVSAITSVYVATHTATAVYSEKPPITAPAPAPH